MRHWPHGLERIGVKVESVDALNKELAVRREADPEMREGVISESSECERRRARVTAPTLCDAEAGRQRKRISHEACGVTVRNL